MKSSLSAADYDTLRQAVVLLEQPSLAARASHVIGSPIEKTLGALPEATAATVQEAARMAIAKALDVALSTLEDSTPKPARETAHKMLSGLSGAVGGFFGLSAIALELPVSTTLILRSVADIARSEGELITATETRLACLEVFALGGPGAADDATESGYYAVRIALAKLVSEAATYLAERGLAESSAPVLLRLISAIAPRFGVTVSQKIASQWVPALGAIGGASVNMMFMQHFQNMARGHFTVRRLERRYGCERIRLEYRHLQGLN